MPTLTHTIMNELETISLHDVEALATIAAASVSQSSSIILSTIITDNNRPWRSPLLRSSSSFQLLNAYEQSALCPPTITGMIEEAALDIRRQVFCKILTPMCRRYDSSGWFAVLFSTKLVSRCQQNSEIATTNLIRAFILASSVVQTELLSMTNDAEERRDDDDDAILGKVICNRISWNDLPTILCVAKTILSRYRGLIGWTSEQIQALAINYLSTFLTSLASISDHPTTCNIVYRHAPGLSLDNIKFLDHRLAMDLPVLPFPPMQTALQRGSSHLVVALFENSLEWPEYPPGYSFHVEQRQQQQQPPLFSCNLDDKQRSNISSMKDLEYHYLEKVANLFQRSKVTLVVCQKRVHPQLMRLLFKRGILCLARLGIRYCGALQKLSGARQLVTLPANDLLLNNVIPPSSLGYVSELALQTIYGREYVVAISSSCSAVPTSAEHDVGHGLGQESESTFYFKQFFGDGMAAREVVSRQSPVSTVLIAAPCELLCEEVETALEEVRQTLTNLLMRPFVLPGRGRWQYLLAKRLRERMQPEPLLTPVVTVTSTETSNGFADTGSSASSMSKAFSVLVDCLDECSRLLGHGHHNRTESSGKNGLQEAEEEEDGKDGSDGDNTSALEAMEPHLMALTTAIEAAICMIDIDAYIISQPATINKSQ